MKQVRNLEKAAKPVEAVKLGGRWTDASPKLPTGTTSKRGLALAPTFSLLDCILRTARGDDNTALAQEVVEDWQDMLQEMYDSTTLHLEQDAIKFLLGRCASIHGDMGWERAECTHDCENLDRNYDLCPIHGKPDLLAIIKGERHV